MTDLPVSPAEEGAGGAAMSPVSSPEGVDAIPTDVLRETAARVTEQAVAGVRVWQRTIEARLERIELAVAEMANTSRVASASAVARSPLQPATLAQPLQSVTSTQPLPVQSPLAAASYVAAQPAAPSYVAAQPAAPSYVAAQPAAPASPLPPPRAAMGSAPAFTVVDPVTPAVRASLHSVTYEMRQSLPSYAVDPHDPELMALSGGRRKKKIAFVAVLIVILGVGGLVAMAIASQAAHGL
jgi:hypothetical protein